MTNLETNPSAAAVAEPGAIVAPDKTASKKAASRKKGATLAELLTATGWQAHSVRGFISTASKKHGVKIESSKNEAGGRVYRIAK